MSLKANLLPDAQKTSNHKRFIYIAITGVLATILLIIIGWFIFLRFNQGVKLVKISPEGEINPRTNLTFYFSGDIVNPDSIGDTFAGDLIKFSPEIPGKYRFISKRELRFLPEVPLRPSTKYKAELKANLVKIKGKYLAGKRIIEFSTYRFKVENVNISFNYQAEQKKGMQLQARFNFNYPVSPAELRKSLKLCFIDLGEELEYNLNSNEKSAQITIISEVLYPGDSDLKIELSLAKGFQCADGGLGLEKSHVVTTVLGAKKELGIIETVTRTDSAKCWISVRCSEPVNPESITGFIQLKPEAPFKVEVDGEYINIRSDNFKPGASYTLSLSNGLPSLNGYPLKREYTKTILFKDLEPSLKFNFPGRYLSSGSSSNLILKTVNIAKVDLEISQISADNIVGFFNSLNGEEFLNQDQIVSFGKVVKSSVITIGGQKNATIDTLIDLGETFPQKTKGFFQVVACDNDERWRRDSKFVIITDLGIVAKKSPTELIVWINSLENLKPKAKVKVSVLSNNNQTLDTAFTDNQGIARFKQMKKEAAGLEPYLILAEMDNDFAFVHLPGNRVSVNDLDIHGRAGFKGDYEAFLYMDRYLFRPGDKGNLVAIIRGPNMKIPPEIPVKLEVRQPDGRLFREFTANTRTSGACEFAITIPDYSLTGRYQANLIIANQVSGTTAFSVEEFFTERTRVEIKTDKEEYHSGETASVRIEGINLFNTPAAGKRMELSVKLEPEPFTPPEPLGSFVFGDPNRSFVITEENLGETKLDINGITTYNYVFTKQATPPAKLKAVFQAGMIEEAGRTIYNYKTVTFHPYDCYIGIKPENEINGEIGLPYRIKYVVTDPQGNLVAKPSILTEVYHITRNSVYGKKPDGSYGIHWEEDKEKVYSGVGKAIAGENIFQYTPNDYGRFLVVLADSKGMARSSFSFFVNNSGSAEYSAWAMEEPEKIRLEPAQKVYRVGDRARIQVKAPFPGKALVTVEREKVYDYKIVDFKESIGEVTIPVTAEYIPNVYVSIHLIRPFNPMEMNAQTRAIGVAPLMVDCSGENIEIKIDSNPEARPGRKLEVSLKINKTSMPAYITLAAVDENICKIADFTTPDPGDYFYGKRRSIIENYDSYDKCLPEAMGDNNHPGVGIENSEIQQKRLHQFFIKGLKPVSLWSGLVKLDRQGMAKVKFNIPQFNGELRLMAVVNSGGKFGSASKTVTVRDPIVLTPVFPRFVAPNDRFTVPVSVFNGTGKPGTFNLRLFTGGPVEFLDQAELNVDLDNNTEKTIYFKLKAKNNAGKLIFRLQAKGNNETCEVNAELPARPATPPSYEIFTGMVTSEKPINLDLEHKWYPETAEYLLILGPSLAVQYAGGLQYLLKYPYGSAEQITSKIFPLIYFGDLAKALQDEVFNGRNIRFFINQGIARLESLQKNNGAFAFWPSGTVSNEWGSIYTAHCLIEARKAGFKVTDQVYNRMIAFLQQIAKNNDKEKAHLQTKVYALYVLSLARKPLKSMMDFLKNHVLEGMTDYSKAQLAVAYYMAGDRETARTLLPDIPTTNTESRETGGNLNSTVRADAIMLGAFADIEPSHPGVSILMNRLQKNANIGYWSTTQENAFALIALSKVLEKKQKGGYHGEVIAGNTKIATFSNAKYLTIKDPRLAHGPISVRISGDGNCYYYLKAGGVSNRENNDKKEVKYGISAQRRLLDRRGAPVNLAGIKQGDLLIAEITLQTKQDNLANIAVEDLLAGGFEIESLCLEDKARLPWMAKNILKTDYIEVKDDHLMLFLNITNPGTYKFYYSLRAVTCGTFVLPPIKAGCMYNPEIFSFASGGGITIN